MGVPNTNTFTLQDVVDEINPTTDDLAQCFTNAIAYKFDPLYEGNKDNLLNFRNYGGTKIASPGVDEGEDIRVSNVSWATCRAATSGQLAYSSTVYGVFAEQASGYQIIRTFLEFDLSAIPSAANILVAELHIRQVTTHDTPTIVCLKGTQSNPVVAGDFDAFTFSDYAMSDSQSTYLNYGNTIRKIVANSTQRSAIQALFGGSTGFKVVLLEGPHDNDNSAPGSATKYGYDLWKAGECLSQYICAPFLHIEYN